MRMGHPWMRFSSGSLPDQELLAHPCGMENPWIWMEAPWTGMEHSWMSLSPGMWDGAPQDGDGTSLDEAQLWNVGWKFPKCGMKHPWVRMQHPG